MKKIAMAMIAALVVLCFVSCTSTLPVNATSNEVGSKVGEATGIYILGEIPLNADNSISTAAKNGGISKISTVDERVTDYIVYQKVTTIVTGE